MFDYDFNTVPERNTYAYWAGFNISMGSIATSLVNAIVFVAYQDPLWAIGSGLIAGLLVVIILPRFVYPKNLK